MPISENQLNTWSHQGSITNSKETGDSIKNAINSFDKFPENISFDVYLQGSYKNDTNVYGESDVDVTVELTSSFFCNLTEAQKTEFGFAKGNYSFFDFRTDIIRCLVGYYGTDLVKPDNKVIRVFPKANRLHADVLACFRYRSYYNVSDEQYYHKGISFFTANENKQIINFPKQHSDNATLKHQATNSWYKAIVRIFKNIRNYLVNNKIFNKEKAPSYFIECFIGNLPNELFGQNYQTTIYSILKYQQEHSWDAFVCLNKINPLWGIEAHTWNQNNAKEFFNEVVTLWNSNSI